MAPSDTRLRPGLAVAVNLLAVAAVAAAALGLLLLLPVLLAQGGPGWAWLALPAVLVTVPHWALVHEAIHGHLLPDRAANDRLGRWLAILFGAPFTGLRFGHLSHHALNARPADRPELYDPSRSSRLRAALAYYPRLFFGLYAFEVASGPLSLLPRRLLRPIVRRVFYEGAPDAAGMADRAERALLAPAALRAIRLDALAILALLAGSFWLYGPAWPVLAGALAGRAFLVSFLDNAPHYGAPLDEPAQGYDLAAPPVLQALVLNTNLHGTHHRHPNLPWPALPTAFAADGARFCGHYLLAPWRQIRGPRPIPGAAPGVQGGGP
jgi:fatty acid desaturase